MKKIIRNNFDLNVSVNTILILLYGQETNEVGIPCSDEVRLRLAVHMILEWDDIVEERKKDQSLACSTMKETLEELLSRNASVSQLGILIAAKAFNVSLCVYYPYLHGKTSLADYQRLSTTYNDHNKVVKKCSLMWCSTFGIDEDLPRDWNPTTNSSYELPFLNHYEPLVERVSKLRQPNK